MAKMAAELVEAKVSERRWLGPGRAAVMVRTASRSEPGGRGAGYGGAGWRWCDPDAG